MTEHIRSRVKYVIGPDGSPLTIADLPPTSTKRWVIRRKAEVAYLTALPISAAGAGAGRGTHLGRARGADKAGVQRGLGLRAENAQHPARQGAPSWPVRSLVSWVRIG